MEMKLFGVFLVLLFVLVGCDAVDVEKSEIRTGNSPLFLFHIVDPLSDTNYTITSSMFEAEENISVFFPNIDIYDNELQEKINGLILYEVYQMLSIFPEREELTLDIEYEIKFSSDRLLSIVYTGIGFVQGSTRPIHLFYALNINMETGEKIVLSDVIIVDERFIELLLSDNAIHLTPYLELKQFVREIISDEAFLYRFQSTAGPMFYFTNDSLGISIDGLGGAAGDHAELEIRYEALISHLE